jgi:hypothetical protein
MALPALTIKPGRLLSQEQRRACLLYLGLDGCMLQSGIEALSEVDEFWFVGSEEDEEVGRGKWGLLLPRVCCCHFRRWGNRVPDVFSDYNISGSEEVLESDLKIGKGEDGGVSREVGIGLPVPT